MNDKGFLIGPALAGKLKDVIERHDQHIHRSFVPAPETRFEDIPRRAVAASPLRIAQYAGIWPKEYGQGNLKFVTLFKTASNASAFRSGEALTTTAGNTFLIDEENSPVVAINLFAYLPAYDPDITRWCMVQKVGTINVYEEGADPAPYPFYVLVAAEC